MKYEHQIYTETVGTLAGGHIQADSTDRMPTEDSSSWKSFAMQAMGIYKETEIASALKSRDYKDATDLVVAIPCALRNRGGGKEIEMRMDDKSNALTSVQTDSLVLTTAYTLKIRGGRK